MALVRKDVLDERIVSIIKVTRIGELGYVPPKSRLLQQSCGVTPHKTTFFIVTAVKTSNLTRIIRSLYRAGPLVTISRNYANVS
jgi:hypothetical protein